eukprot:3477436-Rhodomonas_salina.4
MEEKIVAPGAAFVEFGEFVAWYEECAERITVSLLLRAHDATTNPDIAPRASSLRLRLLSDRLRCAPCSLDQTLCQVRRRMPVLDPVSPTSLPLCFASHLHVQQQNCVR